MNYTSKTSLQSQNIQRKPSVGQGLIQLVPFIKRVHSDPQNFCFERSSRNSPSQSCSKSKLCSFDVALKTLKQTLVPGSCQYL